MKVVVIGATGGTGKIAVRQLLARGDEVTAFARDPSSVKETSALLRVVRGDARDATAVDRAVQGQDAVLCAFGPRSLKKDDVQEVLMRNLLASMQLHGVKRLVNLSAWGAGDSTSSAGVVFWLVRTLILRHVYADKNRGEALLLASPVDYVNVRPGRLIDAPARGGVKTSRDGKGLRAELTREDLATFMVSQLTDPTWLRTSPLVGY